MSRRLEGEVPCRGEEKKKSDAVTGLDRNTGGQRGVLR